LKLSAKLTACGQSLTLTSSSCEKRAMGIAVLKSDDLETIQLLNQSVVTPIDLCNAGRSSGLPDLRFALRAPSF
jgi:hypothetical protein